MFNLFLNTNVIRYFVICKFIFRQQTLLVGILLLFLFFCFRHEIAYAYVYSNPTICGFLDCLHGKDFKHMYSSPALVLRKRFRKEKVRKRCQTPYPLERV